MTQVLPMHPEPEERAAAFERCLEPQVGRLAALCREMSHRFLASGRLVSFGSGAAATDAQHVAVEFVHPVIVGKRALPAFDLGTSFEQVLPVLLGSADVALGFAFQPDAAVSRTLAAARRLGALTIGLCSDAAEHVLELPEADPFVRQEAAEVLYHLLWESVHVFFEHREQGHDVGASAFLYPFLGRGEQLLEAAEEAVRASMLQKLQELSRLRSAAFDRNAGALEAAVQSVDARLHRGGRLLAFGNGGSATDAGDFAFDCVHPPAGLPSIPALSLAGEPASLTALANDIGVEAMFARQIIALARPEDVAVAFTTSGGSANILAGLAEARRRGLLTVAFAGYDGGRIRSEGLADHTLVVASDHIPRIQEVQASLYHTLRRRLGAPNA